MLDLLIDLGSAYEANPSDGAAAAQLRAAAARVSDAAALAQAAWNFPMAAHVVEILAGRALQLDPRNEHALEILATARLLRDGQILKDGTVAAIRDFADAYPTNMRALRFLADLQRSRSDAEGVEATCRAMLRLDPLAADGHELRARTLAEAGDTAGAADVVRQFIADAESSHDASREEDVDRMRAKLSRFERGDHDALL
jgi:cytochrome c-type biogenesis protein CcmH/NrfG